MCVCEGQGQPSPEALPTAPPPSAPLAPHPSSPVSLTTHHGRAHHAARRPATAAHHTARPRASCARRAAAPS